MAYISWGTNFDAFMESPAHEFQYPRNGNFLY